MVVAGVVEANVDILYGNVNPAFRMIVAHQQHADARPAPLLLLPHCSSHMCLVAVTFAIDSWLTAWLISNGLYLHARDRVNE